TKILLLVLLRARQPLRSTLFPYTTLFRSGDEYALGRLRGADRRGAVGRARRGGHHAARGGERRRARRHGPDGHAVGEGACVASVDRKSTRLNSSHVKISYAVFCLKKKNEK